MTKLQDRRQALGKDLKEIADETKIRVSFLKAIEEHNFDKLPVEVYTRAYIKEYAKHLGIVPDETLSAYDMYITQKNLPKSPIQPITQNTKTTETSSVIPPQLTEEIQVTSDQTAKSTFTFSNPAFIKLAFIVIVMVFSGYLFWFYQSSHQGINEVVEYQPPPPTEKPKEVLISSVNEPESKVVNEQTPTVATKESEPKDSLQTFKHSLNIVAVEKVWLQIIIDNNEKKDITLNAGQNLSYKANESFKLLIGNAGGVKIRFDDRLIENLGTSGKVIKITLPEPTSST